ncbi:hypothetical protein [Paenibacillus daejeonensis]|uniref:hypothetical protein n=1 Tax=Paenibacillus daejeonensis TaxID=135193 RepID=UPI00036A4D9F|nr:hypothetical protein [Paenibacillus daejeonensis]
MNKDILLRWDREHQAMERTLEGFWGTFNCWRNKNRDESHDLFAGKVIDAFIRLEERAIYLKYKYDTGETGEAVVVCSTRILYVDKLIGTYDMEFFLNGEVADDYLDLDDVKHTLIPLKHSLRIARNALQLGMTTDEVSRLTELSAEYIEVIKVSSEN